MKNLFSRLSAALLVTAGALLFSAAPSSAQYQGGYDNDGYYDEGYDDYNGNSYYQNFYDDLSPYGNWYDDPQYGYVWCPNAGANFQPYYSNGYWMMTDYGNTWVSNYSWGWAPFHYGRWTRASYGWCWIPGNVWGPAWVSWRSGGGCYGWAPMGPGISVQASFGWNAPAASWVFIPQGQIYNHNFYSYYRGARYNNTYINQTTIINNTYINNRRTYVSGPGRRDLEQAGVRNVPTYNVRDGRRPGAASVNRNEVNFYRPAINRGPGGGRGEINNGGGNANNGSGRANGNPRGGFRGAQPGQQQNVPDRAQAAPDNSRPRGRFDNRPDQPAQSQRPNFNNPAVGQQERGGRGGWNRQGEGQTRPDMNGQPQRDRGWNRPVEQPVRDRNWNDRAEQPQGTGRMEPPVRDRGWNRPSPSQPQPQMQPQPERGWNRPAERPQPQPDRSWNRPQNSGGADWQDRGGSGNNAPQRQDMNRTAPVDRSSGWNSSRPAPDRGMQRREMPSGGEQGGFRGRGR